MDYYFANADRTLVSFAKERSPFCPPVLLSTSVFLLNASRRVLFSDITGPRALTLASTTRSDSTLENG